VDIAIVLDESGSMRHIIPFSESETWFGNDFWGERKKAAAKLVKSLADTDRVAIVAFNHQARLLMRLTFLGANGARESARKAIDQVSYYGGTNIDAGLELGVQQLSASPIAGRHQSIIFLTDGRGAFRTRTGKLVSTFNPATVANARKAGIRIFSIGLGKDIDRELLEKQIAFASGGKYYPVESASALSAVFQSIVKDIDTGVMNRTRDVSQPIIDTKLLFLFRILSWAVMGLVIGAGQGIRENSPEDLRACSWGGLIGGALGGACFDPVTSALVVGDGSVGRAVADIIVGAFIGGSMRLAQGTVEKRSTLSDALPRNREEVVRSPTQVVYKRPDGLSARVLSKVKQEVERER
jgi:hypothetical protein